MSDISAVNALIDRIIKMTKDNECLMNDVNRLIDENKRLHHTIDENTNEILREAEIVQTHDGKIYKYDRSGHGEWKEEKVPWTWHSTELVPNADKTKLVPKGKFVDIEKKKEELDLIDG